MLIFKSVRALELWLDESRKKNISIGFVPTMGALHEGHISLVRAAQSDNDITVCSIFVNPTQFNDPGDLKKYPRTFDEDARLLVDAGTDVLFYPEVPEVYPPGFKGVDVDLNGLDQVMEGLHRPGHFKGVVTVVYRLLEIVKPDKLYMGQKDFQQFTIIDHMIHSLDLNVQLVVCPILREENGLAMSSRNTRLSPEGRKMAGLIHRLLIEGKKLIPARTPGEIESHCLELLNVPGFTPEYFSIVDSHRLISIQSWDELAESAARPIACAAVWLEGVRLIDNEYYD